MPKLWKYTVGRIKNKKYCMTCNQEFWGTLCPICNSSGKVIRNEKKKRRI